MRCPSVKGICLTCARHREQVVADQRIFDGVRHLGRQDAQHGAPGRDESASGTAIHLAGRRCTPLQCT